MIIDPLGAVRRNQPTTATAPSDAVNPAEDVDNLLPAVALGHAVAAGPSGSDALDPDGGAASLCGGSASQPHSSLTTALGDDYGAPSPVFHAFGATAAPVTISVQNRLIESLFSKNAL